MFDDIPYWTEDEPFPKLEHRLVLKKIPLDLYTGYCSCGEYVGTGDNYAIFENFDAHAEKIQRLMRIS